MSRHWSEFYDRFSYAYYEQLTHYNIETMNSEYWLENMIEDRMYENELMIWLCKIKLNQIKSNNAL